MGYSRENLLRRREDLLRELEALESDHQKGAITDEKYQEERNQVERGLVEIMDRMAQARFFSGEP